MVQGKRLYAVLLLRQVYISSSSSFLLLLSCNRENVFMHYERKNTKVHIIKCINNPGSVLMRVSCIHVERDWLEVTMIRLVK